MLYAPMSPSKTFNSESTSFQKSNETSISKVCADVPLLELFEPPVPPPPLLPLLPLLSLPILLVDSILFGNELIENFLTSSVDINN